MFLKNRNTSSKIKRSKVTDYAALIHLVFTVDNNIKKTNNVSPVTIEIVYSFVERFHDIIYCNAYHLVYYIAILKEIILLTKEV